MLLRGWLKPVSTCSSISLGVRMYTSDISDSEYSQVVHSMLELLSDKLLEIEDEKEIPGFDVQYGVRMHCSQCVY